MIKIYTLKHPLTNEIRYIGKTKKKLRLRLQQHIADTKREKTKKANWIKSIIRTESLPIIELLDEVLEEKWEFWEIYWIAQFRAWGFDLVNDTEGGESVKLSPKMRKKHSEYMKERLSNPENNPFYGRKHTKETKHLISIANKGKKHSQDFIERRKEIQENWTPSIYMLERMKETHGRRVIQLTKSMEFVKEFYTIKDASKETNSLDGKITDCCKNKRLSHNDFVWMYKEDYLTLTEEVKNSKILKLEKFKCYK